MVNYREIIRLSQYLPAPYDESLRSDILSDLAGRYADHPAYQRYIELTHDKKDPLMILVQFIWMTGWSLDL